MLVNVLIIFFIILIFYQIFISHIINKINNNTIIESMETGTSQQYKAYDINNPNNALILSQQNAGNIEVLKQQLDKTLGLDKEVKDISGNVATLTTQVNGLIAQQKQLVETKLPSSTPKITGIA